MIPVWVELIPMLKNSPIFAQNCDSEIRAVFIPKTARISQ